MLFSWLVCFIYAEMIHLPMTPEYVRCCISKTTKITYGEPTSYVFASAYLYTKVRILFVRIYETVRLFRNVYIIVDIYRVVTGSFDKTAKIWSPDGSLVHTLKGFLSTVTGTCYVPRDKTIWAAGGTSYAYMFDPKSGENVSTCSIIIC